MGIWGLRKSRDDIPVAVGSKKIEIFVPTYEEDREKCDVCQDNPVGVVQNNFRICLDCAKEIGKAVDGYQEKSATGWFKRSPLTDIDPQEYAQKALDYFHEKENNSSHVVESEI